MTISSSVVGPLRPCRQEGQPTQVMIIDDDGGAVSPLRAVLEAEGYTVSSTMRVESAADDVVKHRPDAVLLSLPPNVVRGLELVSKIRFRATRTAIVVVAEPDEWAHEALRLGAVECVRLPLQADQVLRVLRDALVRRRSSGLVPVPASTPAAPVAHPRSFLGASPPVRQMFDLIDRVAPLNLTVLVTGETGTGKELVARAIHERSRRRDSRFVPVHCSALSASILESELFGHEKGSFTGATNSRRGVFEEAGGGTLFLDEIATITPEVQVKTLRVLQERKIQRVGSSQEIDADFRLVGATNADLASEVAAGRFRQDLFYRLNVFPIHVPPLRERRDDIAVLAQAFRERFAEENQIDVPEIPDDVEAQMMEYDWPGNVRELENFVDRAMVLFAGQSRIHFDLASSSTSESSAFTAPGSDNWTLARLEREHIARVMARTGGRQIEAARILGISRRTLHRRLRSYHGSRAPIALS